MIRSDIQNLMNKALWEQMTHPVFQDDNMNKSWEQGFRYACKLFNYYLPRETESHITPKEFITECISEMTNVEQCVEKIVKEFNLG